MQTTSREIYTFAAYPRPRYLVSTPSSLDIITTIPPLCALSVEITYLTNEVRRSPSALPPITPIVLGNWLAYTCDIDIDKRGSALTIRSTLCLRIPFSPHRFFLLNSLPFPIPHLFPTSDMSHQPGSSHLQVLFRTALQDYEKQTGIELDKHPLAEQLQSCDSVESVTALLCEQTQAFSEFRGKDKALKPLKNAVLALYKLSEVADFGRSIGLVRP
jgi:hypothetical protein